VTAAMIATHATVSRLTTRIENLGHKFYVDSFFYSSYLFDDLHTKAIKCCGTVRSNQKGVPRYSGRKLIQKQGDMMTEVRGD
jgi:hypothetical protein